MKKKLYRSSVDKKIFGVCGGIADYLNIDTSIVRILAVVALFTVSLGFWAYLIMALCMKRNPDVIEETTYFAARPKLYRSRSDKMLFGVCGGIAKYFDVDATVLRVIVALVSLAGLGLIFYILSGIVIPIEPEEAA